MLILILIVQCVTLGLLGWQMLQQRRVATDLTALRQHAQARPMGASGRERLRARLQAVAARRAARGH